MDEQALMEILERLRHRFYGKYRGTVTNVNDPTKRGRIKAKVPAVLGGQETGWCLPCVPYAGKDVGMVFVPEEGSSVWIEFEGGEPSLPIWTGCFWRNDQMPEEASPTVKTIKTKAENVLMFDDDAGSTTFEDANENSVMLDSSGIALERGVGKIVVSDSSVSVNDGALEVT